MIAFPGRIPISIHPFFWIFAAFIGYEMEKTLLGTIVWIGIIFVSVLFHEFGHALTAVLFKQNAKIQLVALGGVTSFEGPKLKFWQQFLITLNGPLFGFLLFLGATVWLKADLSHFPLWKSILKATQFANLFWTIVNLLPVIPLDGGQLLRIVLEAAFGIKGFKAALLIGAVVAALFGFYFFMRQGLLLGAFFFLFAYQSFDAWQKSRYVTRDDRDEGNKQQIMAGELALQSGKKEEAKRIFEEVKAKAGKGVLSVTADQYLAFIAVQAGEMATAYELLLPIKEHLEGESLCLLHKLAFENKNYPLVAELSARTYQIAPNQEMALDNARAFAFEKSPKNAGGWLQTAWQYGGLDIGAILQEPEFEDLRSDPAFKEFVDQLS